VLVVEHPGSSRVILAHVLGAPLPSIRRFAMPYASWSRVISCHGGLYLEYLNRRFCRAGVIPCRFDL